MAVIFQADIFQKSKQTKTTTNQFNRNKKMTSLDVVLKHLMSTDQ